MGLLERVVDYLFFRNFIRLATEWGFETLRLWCVGDENAVKRRRSRIRFLRVLLQEDVWCSSEGRSGAQLARNRQCSASRLFLKFRNQPQRPQERTYNVGDAAQLFRSPQQRCGQ